MLSHLGFLCLKLSCKKLPFLSMKIAIFLSICLLGPVLPGGLAHAALVALLGGVLQALVVLSGQGLPVRQVTDGS